VRDLSLRLLALAAAMAASTGMAAAQQALPGWQPGTQAPATPGGGQPGNTTVIPRSTPEAKPNPALGEMTLAAFLTDDGQRIEQGVVWRIYQDQPAAKDAKPKLIATTRETTPLIKLPPADYIINVAFGRANLSRKITLKAGGPVQERFVLNAGGLKVNALLGKGEPAPERAVSFDVLSGETDQSGGRAKIIGGARPGTIIRLNAGIYHLVSTYGDANAVVQADVTVEPGKLTEASISHLGAKVTFKLVMRVGGEAQADTQWSIVNDQGELVKESGGALPTHVLEPGAYTVTARHAGRSFRRAFIVQSGEASQIEVVMQ
jgi:hypothetical protein